MVFNEYKKHFFYIQKKWQKKMIDNQAKIMHFILIIIFFSRTWKIAINKIVLKIARSKLGAAILQKIFFDSWRSECILF